MMNKSRIMQIVEAACPEREAINLESRPRKEVTLSFSPGAYARLLRMAMMEKCDVPEMCKRLMNRGDR